MKTFIIVLIITSFIQSTILPLNLVLIILICRSYLREDKANLFLAFSFGLLISHLSLQPLGFQSLTFLILIQITQSLSRSRLSANPLLLIPISGVLSSLNLVAISLLAHQSIQLVPEVLIESFLSLPIFYVIRLWEERFVVRKEIKLRV